MVALDSPQVKRAKRKLVKYRRPLAAGSAFLAVLFGLSAIQGPPVVATDDSAILGKSEGIVAQQQLDENLVAAPIRFADQTATSLLREQDVIDVIAADGLGGSALVAAHVEVIALPSVDESAALTRADHSALVVLAVTTSQATELAGAAAVGPLTFTLRPSA